MHGFQGLVPRLSTLWDFSWQLCPYHSVSKRNYWWSTVLHRLPLKSFFKTLFKGLIVQSESDCTSKNCLDILKKSGNSKRFYILCTTPNWHIFLFILQSIFYRFFGRLFNFCDPWQPCHGSTWQPCHGLTSWHLLQDLTISGLNFESHECDFKGHLDLEPSWYQSLWEIAVFSTYVLDYISSGWTRPGSRVTWSSSNVLM